MMDSTRLASRRLSSTAKRSRPVFADVADHRPDLLGSVERPETPMASSLRSPPPHSASVVPPEGIWDGGQAGECATENVKLNVPIKATAAESHPPTPSGPGKHRPRGWWLAGLLGTLGASVLLLLALPGHGHHSTHPHSTAGRHPKVSGVGMPTTRPGNTLVKPLRIAVVLGDGLTPKASARETQALKDWLSGHVNPATRLTVVDAANHLTTRALLPIDFGSSTPAQHFRGSWAGVLRSRLATGRGNRLLVSFNDPYRLTGGNLARLHLVSRRGAELPSLISLRPGQTITAVVDPSQVHALAATAARAVISISHMSEG